METIEHLQDNFFEALFKALIDKTVGPIISKRTWPALIGHIQKEWPPFPEPIRTAIGFLVTECPVKRRTKILELLLIFLRIVLRADSILEKFNLVELKLFKANLP